ncbi:MAG: hypothetical protein PGN33_20125 [Methylobacterium radiotolerans]
MTRRAPSTRGWSPAASARRSALQFSREIDAVLYRRAHLGSHIAWIVERLPPRLAPPAWNEGAPPDPLLEGLQEELARDPLTDGFPYS